MRKWVIVGLIVFLLVVIIGAVAALNGQTAARVKAASAEKDVVKVERGELNLRVVETGSVDAVKVVEIRSRASGRLAKLMVDEGDVVDANQLVAQIDPQETELRVEQDQAQLRGAKTGIERANLEIRQQEVLLREAVRTSRLRVETLKDELRIQPTLTSTAVTQAKSQLESAKRQLEQLERVTQPNQKAETQRLVDDARNSLENSRREYNRQVELEKQGYVAARVVENARLQVSLDETRLRNAEMTLGRLDDQQRLEHKRAEEDVRSTQAAYDRSLANGIQDASKKREYEQALSDLNRAQANLTNLGILKQQRIQSQSSVDQLNSALKDSLRQLRETDVRAPFAGVVVKRYIEVGDLVTALSTFSSGTSIVRIEDRSKMRVKLELNEIDVARLTKGMKASVEIDALPGKVITGTVEKIAPASTATGAVSAAGSDAVVKYQVEVYLDSIPDGIRSGMSAKCSMDVFKKENVIRVPVAYLGKDKDGSYVMIAPDKKDPKATATRRNVKVGLATGAFVEIVDGLKEGERLAKPAYTGPQRQGMIQAGGPDEE